MVDQIIRPADLPTERTNPVSTEFTVTDNGSTVAKVTLEKAALAGRPTASQAEAEAGVDPLKAMTPLTTKQAVAYQGAVLFASSAQGSLADTAVQPEDLSTVATTGDYDDLINKPVLQDATSVESRAWAIANLHPISAPSYIRTAGYTAPGDGGGALYKSVGSEPGHSGKFSITLADTVTIAWYEISESAVSPLMFGAKGDSVIDDKVELQAAATFAAGKTLIFDRIFLTSVTIAISSNTIVIRHGDIGGLKLSTGNISGLALTSATGCKIRDLTITCDVAGATAYIAAVWLYQSSHNEISGLNISGMTWSGVLLWDSSYNTVKGSRFSAWRGAQQDSNDIGVYGNSNYNVIDGNFCLAGANCDHGIFVFDPYVGATPTGNKVVNNEVGEHNAYGILVYTTTSYNTKTLVQGNTIHDILGNQVSGQSGAGIYIASASGTTVNDNSVFNCCRNTVNFGTLAMACISVNTENRGLGGEEPIIVSNNNVVANRGPGIRAVTSAKSCMILNNSVRCTSTENVTGDAILIEGATEAVVSGNVIHHINPNSNAIRCTASASGDMRRLRLQNNTVFASGSSGGIFLNVLGTSRNTDAVVSGNSVSGTIVNSVYWFQNCPDLRFYGNSGEGGLIAFAIRDCPRSLIEGNNLRGTLAQFKLTNTGSRVSETNRIGVSQIQNDGTGTIISMFGSAIPSSSHDHSVGDRIIQSVPVVGSPKGWRCTVAGTPGTWVSEGNL